MRGYLNYLFKDYRLLTFDEIDSTNSEAVRIAKKGINGNYVILAKRQTKGRGRNNKYWHSEEGNIYFSLLLNTNITVEMQPQLSLVTGLAVYNSIKFFAKKMFTRLNCKLKWPNDLLIGNKKLSGILLESIKTPITKDINSKCNLGNLLIIGVGINIIKSPAIIDRETTSLLEEGIIIDDPKRLLLVFLNYFDLLFTEWQNNGFLSLKNTWLKRAYKLNHSVMINGENKINGIFCGIDNMGRMQVKLPKGEIITLTEAEIIYE
jgi:BirA family biotin operon repressor/biotin-[acetyl-CoA-carboxylase] ligase